VSGAPDFLPLLIWGIGAFVLGCVAYEYRDEIEASDSFIAMVSLPAIIFWPLALVVAVAIGALWLASWTVRGPIRLALWIREEITVRRIIREADRVSFTILGDEKSVRCADSKALPKAWARRKP
jgi:hypothetical protein